MAKAATKRKLSRPRALPAQRLLPFNAAGQFHDLRSIFDRVKSRHFPARRPNVFAGYTITWGRRRRLPPKEYFIFGTIQEEDRLIRIHPLLDAPWVPVWFLEYVIYHEMLHAVVPDALSADGRRRVHTPEFYRREKQFPHYRRARRWEDENLNRLLR